MPANRFPQIVGFFVLPTAVAPGGAAKATVQARDADGDSLRYRWTVSAGRIEGDGATVTWYTPVVPEDSLYTISITVEDGRGGRADAALEVPVLAEADAQTCTVPCDQIIRVGPARCDDCIGMPSIPALNDPPLVPANHPGADYLTEETMVIGLVMGNDVRAYPVLVLNRHEVINDHIGGRPVTVTYCPFTASPIVFDRRQGAGAGRTFNVSGFLYNANLILFDLQEKTLWSQMRAEAIRGRGLGRRLDQIQASFLTWGGWKRLFPDTRVLSRDTGFNMNYVVDEYASYETSPYLWAPVQPRDERLPVKERVLGVFAGGRPHAFPWSVFSGSGIRPFALSGVDILLVWDSQRRYFAAFAARTSRGAAHFAPADSGKSGLPMFVDEETGTLWNAAGLAIAGPLQGERLQPPSRSYSAYWFAWAAFWPDTELILDPIEPMQ